MMELLILIDACRRASAARITAVIPYFGYARQDRKDAGRVPITAKLVANLIVEAGADRVLTMDLHAAQIQGFFDVPVDHLYAAPILDEYFESLGVPSEEIVVLSPDEGSIKRSLSHVRRLGGSLAIVDKRREKAGVSEVMNIIGDVDGRVCVMVDDIVDSSGTLCNAAAALKGAGASEVHAYVTHAVLSGGAVARVSASDLKSLVVTDSIAMTEAMRISDSVKTLSIAKLMAEAIRRISAESSVSSLFN
jgi:ribose-phosphate pyrophosphokinase